MLRNILSNKRTVIMLVALAAMFLAFPAMAQSSENTVGGVAVRINDQLADFANLLTGAMFLVGIGLGAMAALKFKAHNEEPRSNKITTPIVLAVVSACLIGLPAYLTYVQNSVVGEDGGGSLDESVYDQIGG